MAKLGITKADHSIFDRVVSAEDDMTIPKIQETVLLTVSSTSRPKNSRYVYVAKSQRTKFAVIAVHTLEEKFLFLRLHNECFASVTTPNFEHFALKWNMYADGDRVFYKCPEHLEKYYNHWKEQEAAKRTRNIHCDVIDATVTNIKTKNAPAVTARAMSPSLPNVNENQNREDIQLLNEQVPFHSSSNILHFPMSVQNMPFTFRMPIESALSAQRTNLATPIHLAPQMQSSLRTVNIPTMQQIDTSISRRRKCKGCGQHTCPGKFNRRNCPSAICLNCGKSQECNGIWDKNKCNA